MRKPYQWLSTASVFATLTAVALADVPAARYGAQCALLDNKIYCYGGGQPVVNKADPQSMEDFQYLDVSQNFSVSQSSAAWTSLSTNGSVDPEPNFLFNMIAIPDSNSLFMNGGLGYNNGTGLLHQAKAYNIDQNSWSIVSTPAGMLQTRQSTMILGQNNKVYIWGGRSDHDTGFSGGQDYLNEMRILTFALGNATQNTLNMAWKILNTLPSNIYPRIDCAATLSGDGTKIFYTGGLAAQPSATNRSSYTLTAVDMSNILTYDTTNGNWETLQTSGPTPAKRVVHTATLKANTTKIVIYGGCDTNTRIPVKDTYDCYTLDTDSLTYTGISLPGSNAPGGRCGHSAVMKGDDLFILFGLDSSGSPHFDFHVLDTNSWNFTDNYTPSGPSHETIPGQDGDSVGSSTSDGGLSSDSSLSGGAIAGVVIGCVAGVGMLVGAFVFCFLRRRRSADDKRESRTKEKEVLTSEQETQSQPPPQYEQQSNSYQMLPSAYKGRADKPDGSAEGPIVLQSVKPDGL
ncbi:hypothetical protein BCR43DRAFT_495261 [Syncephalastrum racemosum]|uniref:Galactose oxidase n=1 Tax=Syncephalastrum racemosum TaxID=13706 RepID=A0A1X2H6V4_SYNRA|nr:hypothetical protein BCR43DRAFT_495261 [Syncephalastrum racemosum]